MARTKSLKSLARTAWNRLRAAGGSTASSRRAGPSRGGCLKLEALEQRTLLSVGPYAPPAGQEGSTAISMDDTAIVGWATGYEDLVRGPVDIDDPEGTLASYGTAENALGQAVGNSYDVVSLGDGGQITLTFDTPISNGAGADFAVFENGFSDTFLELAYVEVSSNGEDFFRFDSVSLTPTDTQVGGFGSLDATNLYDLAGKYRQGYGTPFDLDELADVSPLLDVTQVTHVRIVDVVGSITEVDGNATWSPSLDSEGNIINDPYATAFSSGGFDLEAVAVLHSADVTLEDVGASLADESFWNGSDESGGFLSGGVAFNNSYNSTYDSWEGWAYSNTTDTTTAGYTNQYSAYAGAGAGDSNTYAVAYASGWGTTPTIELPAYSGLGFESITLTNTTYAALSMLDGDSVAKQFGGSTGDDEDWFLLTITGVDADGTSVGTVDFYLADYTSADNSEDYIVDEWVSVDLTSLDDAVALEFSLSSSDVGDWGMNTPAYFAVDDVTLYNASLTDFEDVGASLAAESHYDESSDGEYTFESGQFTFDHAVSWSGYYWDQWTYSNETDVTTAGYTNQYSAYLAETDSSNTYAIAYSGVSGGYGEGNLVTLEVPDDLAVGSLDVTNTTYAALSMLQGDDFARPFGYLDLNDDGDYADDGEYDGDYPDWFLLTITGFDGAAGSGEEIGTVEFYLADYRFEDDYVVDEWTTVDLTSLAGATELEFSLSSSDVGTWGMNTPSYFAVDNIVVAAPEVVTLQATDADDVIAFVATETQYEVTINGETEVYDRTGRTEFYIDGLEGSDRITVVGTDGYEEAILDPDSVDVVGWGYAVYATSVETISVNGGGGENDTATLTGSTGSNRLYSYDSYTRMSDLPRTFSQQVEGFEDVTVDAGKGSGNYAFVYDSADNEILSASPEGVDLSREDGTTSRSAAGFEKVYVYATSGGDDSAELTGADGARNRLYSYPDYTTFTESARSFYFYVRGFDSVEAASPGDGASYAYIYDSSGDDSLETTPSSATMDRDGSFADLATTGFARVYAYATRGGTDTAVLNGSDEGGNRYRGYPTYSTLTDATASFYTYARGFDSLTAVGSDSDTSGDRAYLYDSSGNDILTGELLENDEYQGVSLTDEAGTYQNAALYFDLVYARSYDSGTTDTIDIDEDLLACRLIDMGTW